MLPRVLVHPMLDGLHGLTLEEQPVPQLQVQEEPEPVVVVALALYVLVYQAVDVIGLEDPGLDEPGLAHDLTEQRAQLAPEPVREGEPEPLLLSAHQCRIEVA